MTATMPLSQLGRRLPNVPRTDPNLQFTRIRLQTLSV